MNIYSVKNYGGNLEKGKGFFEKTLSSSASSAALYVEEAIRLRNKMVKEMASRYARERETRLCACIYASCLGLQVRQNYSSEPNRRVNAVTPVDKDNVIKSEATIQGG